jgi:hypothetical protein
MQGAREPRGPQSTDQDTRSWGTRETSEGQKIGGSVKEFYFIIIQ